jgi:multidrug efflux pump subunit AcrA (membrane-fusion protein)
MTPRYIFQMLMLALVLITGCSRDGRISPQRKDIVDAVFASGDLKMNDRYMVTSMTEGYLLKSFVDEGDTVFLGQELFHIRDDAPRAQLENAEAAYRYALRNVRPDSPVLQKLNQQLVQLENQLETDSLNFRRFRNLISSNAVSQADYDQAKLAYENTRAELKAQKNSIDDTQRNLNLDLINARANLVDRQDNSDYYTLTSKVDSGIVLQTMKEDGELVKKGETLAEIGAGEFIAMLDIAEEDINRVTLGQEVYIELNTQKDKSYKARITKLHPAFDQDEQSFIAEAVFTEPVPFLKSGAQLQANIVVQKKQNALVIPSSYLLPHDQVNVAGKNDPVKVETGMTTNEWVEIVKGVNEHDVLILPRK